MKHKFILLCFWCTVISCSSYAQKDSTKKHAVTVEKTVGIHSLAYVGIPGSVLSRNPNIDAAITLKFPHRVSFFAMKAVDVYDIHTLGNNVFFMVSKEFVIKRWTFKTSMHFFDYQTKRLLDYEQAIYMPQLFIQHNTPKSFFMTRWTYFAVIQPKWQGHITEVAYGHKWKPFQAEMHAWFNSGTFGADPGISVGLRIKPTLQIPVGRVRGSIIFDGNLNLTNRLDETKKAGAKEALAIRTYWSW